jgi:hypothetical protein
MRLERHILVAFRLAMREGRLTAADHLLKALEALSRDHEDALDEAYKVIAEHVSSRPVTVVQPEHGRQVAHDG